MQIFIITRSMVSGDDKRYSQDSNRRARHFPGIYTLAFTCTRSSLMVIDVASFERSRRHVRISTRSIRI